MLAVQRGTERFDQTQRRIGVHARQGDEKLLTAPAPDNIRRLQQGSCPVGKTAQHHVASGMAVNIVDPLEMIEIDQDDGDFGVRKPSDHALAQSRRLAAIVQPRQRIAAGNLLQRTAVPAADNQRKAEPCDRARRQREQKGAADQLVAPGILGHLQLMRERVAALHLALHLELGAHRDHLAVALGVGEKLHPPLMLQQVGIGAFDVPQCRMRGRAQLVGERGADQHGISISGIQRRVEQRQRLGRLLLPQGNIGEADAHLSQRYIPAPGENGCRAAAQPARLIKPVQLDQRHALFKIDIGVADIVIERRAQFACFGIALQRILVPPRQPQKAPGIILIGAQRMRMAVAAIPGDAFLQQVERLQIITRIAHEKGKVHRGIGALLGKFRLAAGKIGLAQIDDRGLDRIGLALDIADRRLQADILRRPQRLRLARHLQRRDRRTQRFRPEIREHLLDQELHIDRRALIRRKRKPGCRSLLRLILARQRPIGRRLHRIEPGPPLGRDAPIVNARRHRRQCRPGILPDKARIAIDFRIGRTYAQRAGRSRDRRQQGA